MRKVINSQFLKLYQKTLFDLAYFDNLEKIGNVQIASTGFDDSVWWNNATFDGELTDEIIAKAERYFRSINRKPIFYFAEDALNEENEKLLINKGYAQTDYEVWLEQKTPKINVDRFDQIRKVENEQDLEVFIKTIDRGYGADDPDNPYGGLGDYLSQIRESFRLHGASGKITRYIIFDENDNPASVGSLTNYERIGYISNIATVLEKRRQGYSAALLNYLLDNSVKAGNKTHCLATEVGSVPDKIYRKVGFTEMFRAKYYTKEGK
jgi:GNAT superfamily N-acetyltransferase